MAAGKVDMQTDLFYGRVVAIVRRSTAGIAVKARGFNAHLEKYIACSDELCVLTIQHTDNGAGFSNFVRTTGNPRLARISDTVQVAQRHGVLTP